MYSIQELRDLKLLQKQEQKQFQDLAFKNQLVKEQQEKRFEVERVTLMKNYDNDLSSMIDSQKKQVDKCEQQQHEELKVSSKRIRNEQVKELKKGSVRALSRRFVTDFLQGDFFNWDPPKNHKFFSESKIRRTFELGPP